MNVVISPNEYNSQQIYFTERKTNTHIPNSTFNRITYSTPDFTMNGIYIHFELLIYQVEQNFNSNIYNCRIDTQNEHNRMVMASFQNIETSILDKWMRIQNKPVGPVGPGVGASNSGIAHNDIIQQLRDGVISVWKHNLYINDKPQFYHFIIKISGVWENDTGCGLTYKFI